MQKKRLNVASVLLCACIFASGGCGIILEYIQASTASMILGNSFEQWALVIGLMLFWMGFASIVQVHIKSAHLIYAFIAVETGLALTGGFSPLLTFFAYSHTAHYAVVLYFFVSFIGIMIGLEIPVIIRINNNYTAQLKTNVGSVLSADYLGSLTGALIYVYLILRFVSLPKAAFLTAFVNFLLAFVTYLFFLKKRLIKSVVPLFLMSGTLIAIGFGYINSDEWIIHAEQPLYDDPVIYSNTSRYQHIVITHYKPHNDVRLFLDGNLQLCSLDEKRYHEPLVHPAMTLAGQREKVLILGGGDGCALREVLKYKETRTVMVVDLDPAITELSSTHPLLKRLNKNAFKDARIVHKIPAGVTAGPSRLIYMENQNSSGNSGRSETIEIARANVMNIDADIFLEKVPSFWDVIIVDLPDPATPELVKLYSRQFYLKIKKRLSKSGVMVTQATSPYFARESFLMIGRTIQSAGLTIMPYHHNVPSFGDWGWYLAWHPETQDCTMKNKIARMSFSVETDFLTEKLFSAGLAFGKRGLKTARTDINVISKPSLLYVYNHECWQLE